MESTPPPTDAGEPGVFSTEMERGVDTTEEAAEEEEASSLARRARDSRLSGMLHKKNELRRRENNRSNAHKPFKENVSLSHKLCHVVSSRPHASSGETDVEVMRHIERAILDAPRNVPDGDEPLGELVIWMQVASSVFEASTAKNLVSFVNKSRNNQSARSTHPGGQT